MMPTLPQLLRFLKSFLWAVLGMSLTFLIALFVTSDLSNSLGIGIAEFVFTTLTYYIHEFLWDRASNLLDFPLHNHAVSVAQALSWRVTGTVLTIGIVFVFTGEVGDALQVGIGEVIVKIGIFYGYARLWLKVMRRIERRRRGPLERAWYWAKSFTPWKER